MNSIFATSTTCAAMLHEHSRRAAFPPGVFMFYGVILEQRVDARRLP